MNDDVRMVTESMVSVDLEDAGDGNLLRFFEWLKVYVEEIPKEFVAGATISLTADYESAPVAISIDYERPETAEEIAERVNHEVQSRQNEEARERAIYAMLDRKYGTPK